MNTQLIFPMAVYVLFMFCSGLLLFGTRLKAIQEGKVSIKYFKTFVAESLPERMVLVGRHYDNQFQVPLLFLITCLLQMQINMVSFVSVGLAWAFVLSRFIQSWFILGSSNVKYRALAFVSGWILVMTMWLQIALFYAMATVNT